MSGIRKIVREVLETTGLTDVHEIATKAVQAVPDDDLRPSLIDALPALIRIEIGQQRRDAFNGRTQTPAQPSPPQPMSSRQPTQSRRPGKLGRLDDHTEVLNHPLLKQRIHTATGFKLFAECTVADFRFAASERTTKAHNDTVWARRFESAAAVMEKAGVKVAGELPTKQLNEIMAVEK
jgi:hypothetical protein